MNPTSAPGVHSAAAYLAAGPVLAAERRRTGRRRASRLRDLVAGWGPVLVAVVLAVLLWPSSLGGCTTVVVVSGGSMEPTYAPGDLLVARCGPTAVGDVVVYEPPGVPGARVVHRVVDGDASGWVLQGDANDWLDPWEPGEEHVLGRVVLHVPGFGLTPLLLSPLPWAAVLLVGAGLLVWPRRDEPGADGAPDGTRDGSDEPTPGATDRTPRARRRLGPAAAVGASALVLVVAAVPEPADAAALHLAGAGLLAWTAPVDLEPAPPPLPPVSCTTDDPAVPCTAEVELGHSWDRGFVVDVVIRDARPAGSTERVRWTVTLNLSGPPFPWVPESVESGAVVAVEASCGPPRTLVVQGNPLQWNDRLGPGETVRVQLQGHRDDPTAPGNLLDCR